MMIRVATDNEVDEIIAIDPIAATTAKLFTSTNESNAPMQALLASMSYEPSGIVHNLDDGDPELFYFKRVKS